MMVVLGLTLILTIIMIIMIFCCITGFNKHITMCLLNSMTVYIPKEHSVWSNDEVVDKDLFLIIQIRIFIIIPYILMIWSVLLYIMYILIIIYLINITK